MIKFRFLTYSNFGLFEKWYEDMAKRGFQIEKIPMPIIHKFKKTEPEDVKYRVIMAPNEGYFSAFSKEELEDYDSLAEEFGWQLIDRSFNTNVYKLEEGAAESLYNDYREEREILDKGIKGELISLTVSLLVFLFIFFFVSGRFFSYDIFYSNHALFMYPASILILLFGFTSMGDYISFKRRNKNIENVREMKFSKISFSKAYVLLILISFLLIFLGLIFQSLSMTMLTREKIFIMLFPLIIFFVTYFYVKKVKKLNTRTRTKKILLVIIPIILIILINGGTFKFLFGPSQDLERFEDFGAYKILAMDKSFLTLDHDLYEAKEKDLRIEKTQARSKDLANLLFERKVKNARNHPYKAERVKDISPEFFYDKTFRMAEENEYLILYKDMVLDVSGNIYDDQVQRDIEEILEVERWLGTNSKH